MLITLPEIFNTGNTMGLRVNTILVDNYYYTGGNRGKYHIVLHTTKSHLASKSCDIDIIEVVMLQLDSLFNTL